MSILQCVTAPTADVQHLDALPAGARAIGVATHCLALLFTGWIGWVVFGSQPEQQVVDSGTIITDTLDPANQSSDDGNGEHASASDQQGNDGRRDPSAEETQPAIAPREDDPQPEAVSPVTQTSVAEQIRCQFTGKVLSSTETYRHPFEVAAPFEPILLQAEVRHLGDNKIDRWDRANADGQELRMEFEFLEVSDCLVRLSFDLFDADFDNPVFLNGEALGFLPRQVDEQYQPMSLDIPRQRLRTGQNELRITVVAKDDNLDDLLIRNIQLLPGPALFRVQLSRVPGVDGRLGCYQMLPDGERKQVFLLNESQEAEEVYPNWAPLAGNYEFEIQADGANPDVEYVLDIHSDGFVTEHEECEPNDVSKSATTVKIDQTLRGFVSRDDDRDLFAFNVLQKEFLTAQLKEVPDANLALQLLDNNQRVTKTFDAGAIGEGERTDLLELEPGTWYLSVSAAGTASVDFPYRLSLQRVAGRQGYAGEPNDNASQAVAITAGKSIRGTLNPPDEEDWFRFTVADPDEGAANSRYIVRFHLTPLDGVQLQAKLDGGSWLPAGGIGAEYGWKNWVVKPGNHTIAIRGHQQDRVDMGQEYRLRADVLNIDEADDGYSVGNNSPDTRLSQTPSDVFRSALYPWEVEDYYELTIEADGMVYRLREDRPFLNRLGIEIRDLEQNVLKRIGPTTLRNWSPATGRYIVRVFRHNNADRHVDYAFRFLEDHVWNTDEEREFNDTQETASELTLNSSLAAWFSPNTKANPDHDWYRIAIPEDDRSSSYAISVEPEGDYVNLGLQLVDTAGQSRGYDTQKSGPEVIENWSPPPGEYYLVCSPLNTTGKSEPYSVRWERTGTRSDLREFEPNNLLAEATPLRLDRLVKGDLDSKQDVDIFQVTGASEPLTVLFRLQGSDRVQRVEILDEQGNVISPKQTPHGGTLDFQNYVLPPDLNLNVRVVADNYYYKRSGREYSIAALKLGVWHDGVETEPNGAEWEPTNLPVGTRVTGAIRPEKDVDRFLWNVSDRNQLYRLTIEPPAGQKLRVRIELPLSSDERWTFLETEIHNQPLVVPNLRLGGGDVLITTWAPSQKQGKDYSILVEPLTERLAEHDVEPNHGKVFTPLVVGDNFKRGFHSSDDRDNYRIDADGRKTYELVLSSRGRQPTKAIIYTQDEKDEWVSHKQFEVGNGDEQVVHSFRPQEGRYTVTLNASYGDANYTLRIARSQDEEGTEQEPNDRFVDARPFEVGQSVRGWADVSNDHDYFKVVIDAAEGQVVQATWKSPEDSSVAWLFHQEGNNNDLNINLPKGQVAAIDNLWLARGTYYFGVRRNDRPAQYEFDLQPLPYDANKGYQTWGSSYGEQPLPSSGTISGRLIPFVSDWDAYSFTLQDPSAVLADLSAIAETATVLAIRNAQKQDVFVSDFSSSGIAERLYLPFLNAGRYYLEVRASSVRPDARDYALTLRKATAGFFFPAAVKQGERNVADFRNGGHIVSATSQYDASSWSAARLIDGGTQSNGWSSASGAILPQEIVIGFLQDRTVWVQKNLH